jgi:hypothetical protein
MMRLSRFPRHCRFDGQNSSWIWARLRGYVRVTQNCDNGQTCCRGTSGKEGM